MKTAEQIIIDRFYYVGNTNVFDHEEMIAAMEEYAKAYANHLAESYSDLHRAYELEREHTISLVEQLELVTAMNNENERLIQRLQKTRDRLYALLTKHKIEIPQ